MANKIVISPDAKVACPKCGHEFALRLGITQQTIDRYENEYEAALTAEKKELEGRLAKEAERKASKAYNEQIDELKEKLKESKEAADEAKAAIAKARAEAREKAHLDFEAEKKALSSELAEKDEKLKAFREQEIQLRNEKRAIEEARQNFEIELARKLDEERKQIQQQAATTEAERFQLREAELKKQINDALSANEDLRRKLEQGSQQRQGEVLELEVERVLTDSFRHDRISEVKKGQRGADVIHTVCTPAGTICGSIIWEAKRAENWSEKWLTKLKDDQSEARADIAVLVTTAMPKGQERPFYREGDVWIVAPHLVRPVAEMLRMVLLEVNQVKVVNSGRGEKMELLYNYLASAQFAQKIRTMLDAFESMRSELEAEKRAFQRIWAKRQTQIERVTTAMVTTVGELQAIASDSLPQLGAIEQLSLQKSDDDLSDL